MILQAIEAAGYRPGEQIALGLDCAASEFYKDGRYHARGRGPGARRRRMDRHPGELGRQVPHHQHRGRHGRGRLGRLEDADRRAWASGCSWSATTCSSPTPRSCKEGIDKGIANSILIKINQIGTLTETFAAIEMAKRAGYTAVISHRSGETEDSTIADIAVGTNAGQIKTGSLSRSDRMAKYNQLLRIEEDLGDVAWYPGRSRLLQPASNAAGYARGCAAKPELGIDSFRPSWSRCCCWFTRSCGSAGAACASVSALQQQLEAQKAANVAGPAGQRAAGLGSARPEGRPGDGRGKGPHGAGHGQAQRNLRADCEIR